MIFSWKMSNLLTGFPEIYSIEDFVCEIEKIKLQSFVKHPLVYHFYYEFGLIEQGLGHLVSDDLPLVIEIEYQRSLKKTPKKPRLDSLPLQVLERPNWTEYKLAFQKVQEEQKPVEVPTEKISEEDRLTLELAKSNRKVKIGNKFSI
jgi:hypothetical protein